MICLQGQTCVLSTGLTSLGAQHHEHLKQRATAVQRISTHVCLQASRTCFASSPKIPNSLADSLSADAQSA